MTADGAPRGLAIALVDTPFVFLLQWSTFPTSPSASGVAGFTVGVYVLFVILATLSLDTRYVWLTAASGALFEILLQALAGVSVGAMISTVLLLGLTTLTCSYARDRLVARLLFGGRVMVLARDESVLSITEVNGAATIAVEGGRVAVTVDRGNLALEDVVEVRTPHATVTVPGGTLVVQVADVSTFTSMGCAVEVFRLDRLGGAALVPLAVVAANETVTVEPESLSSGVIANR